MPSSPSCRRAASSIGAKALLDLLDGDAPLEEPWDQLGTLGAGLALEAVEQARCLDVEVFFGHRLNVYRVRMRYSR